MKRLVGIIAVFMLAACAPTSGIVVEKNYDDADTWTTFETVYTTVCDSKNVCRQQASGSRMVQHYDPAHWSLKLDDGEDKGWTNVDERTWHGVAVGQTYNRKTGEVS